MTQLGLERDETITYEKIKAEQDFAQTLMGGGKKKDELWNLTNHEEFSFKSNVILYIFEY